MPKKAKYRTLIVYGLLMGGLFIVLQAVNYKAIIKDVSIEMYGVFIAIVFLGIGLWVGFQGFNKNRTLGERKVNNKSFNLSSREIDVLKLMSEGLTNKEIAERLYVSHNTVKTHTSNIYSKLAVERRTQAIQKARDHELI